MSPRETRPKRPKSHTPCKRCWFRLLPPYQASTILVCMSLKWVSLLPPQTSSLRTLPSGRLYIHTELKIASYQEKETPLAPPEPEGPDPQPFLCIRFVWNIFSSSDPELTLLDVYLTAEDVHLVGRPGSIWNIFTSLLRRLSRDQECSSGNTPPQGKIIILWALFFFF